MQWVLAPEYWTRTRAAKSVDPKGSADLMGLARATGAMHVGFRTGIGEHGEVGLQGDLPGSLGIDGKWNAVRTGPFDLAFLARVTASGMVTQPTSGHYADEAGLSTFLHLPVLLGFNVDRVTIVLSPGATTLLNGQGRVTQGVRLGAGVQVRIATGFAVHPEASWMREVAGPTDLGIATVGLGFLFPKLPP